MAEIDFDSIPSGVSLSAENIDRLSDRATEAAAAFARKLEKLQATFSEARTRYNREADELVASADSDSRAVAKQFAKKQAAQRLTAMRRTLVDSSRREREEVLKALAGYAADAAFLLTLNQSAAQMLGRVALGEARRTNLIQQLEGAGPVELETAARTAIATGDVVLAAAIATVIDRRPLDRRPFSVTKFAKRVYGEEFARVSTKLKGIQLAERTALAANNEFIRGKADPLMNLSNQLAARAIAEASADGDA